MLAGLLCVLLNGPSFANDDVSDLKKLFTDKQQRAHIDAMRSGKQHGPAKSTTGKVEVKGYVTRSDGKSVAWVNNKNTLEKTSLNDIRVHQTSIGKNKKVGVTVDGKYINLKPGEKWDKETGKVKDNY
jgi:hypothetical protein